MSKHNLITRRKTLKLLPPLLGLGTAIGIDVFNDRELAPALGKIRQNFTVVGNKSLRARAAAKGVIYGAAVRYNDLTSSPAYAKAVAKECGVLVPEWELKWTCGDKTLRPDLDKFDFRYADWIANYAKQHQALMRGHTLVWHESLPKWFAEKVNRQNAESVLTNHIQTVVGHYAGRMHSWDVVNEALGYWDRRSDGLRNTPWLKLLGKDYIDLSFRLAAAADPHAILTYNDFGVDYSDSKDEAKREAVLKLLQSLKSKGTPIHALGIQAHLSGERSDFSQSKFRAFLKDVASLGLKIMITELDVIDKQLPKDLNQRDRIIAGAYEDYLAAALDERATMLVTTWGLSDRYSWIAEFAPRQDRSPVRPLPLDANFKRKLAWKAIARAFDAAPKR